MRKRTHSTTLLATHKAIVVRPPRGSHFPVVAFVVLGLSTIALLWKMLVG